MNTRQKIETAVGRALIGLPDPVVRALAGAPIVREGRVLDAQAQLALRAQKLTGAKPSHELTVEQARRELDLAGGQLAPAPAVLGAIDERTIAGRKARVYRPRDQSGAALVFFHGGGHTSGSLDSHDLTCRAMASASCTVISIEYRLAPEHPFPAAADDATAAFRAVIADAVALGIDANRVGVAGDSAGGNLAAVVAIDTRADVVKPRVQLLVYPVVDLTMSFPSVTSFGSGFFLERETIAWFRHHYMGTQEVRHPRASPWFADVSGTAAAIVVTAGFDPLRDEGDAYARKLADAGVPVDHRSYPGLFHGFWNTSGIIRASRSAFDEVMALVRAAL